jgi:predicted metal-dependent HD superfamily phosphohydrolase
VSILIDPPSWPAHGTHFSHLVSDASLDELHGFARDRGLPERAFDRDHYDVPQERYDDLVAAGAVPLPATELVRRLIASGLRVRAKERPERLDAVLFGRWDALGLNAPELGRELLACWSQQQRVYHDRAHLLAVLTALDTLTGGGTTGSEHLPVYLAAWFHDAVYRGTATDEDESAALAAARLSGQGIGASVVDEVVRLVLLTKTHKPAPGDGTGSLLCDADLEVLARPAAAYRRYAAAVRLEYAHVPDVDFARGRAGILRGLLDGGSLYSSERGRSLWENAARANLTAELEELETLGS